MRILLLYQLLEKVGFSSAIRLQVRLKSVQLCELYSRRLLNIYVVYCVFINEQ